MKKFDITIILTVLLICISYNMYAINRYTIKGLADATTLTSQASAEKVTSYTLNYKNFNAIDVDNVVSIIYKQSNQFNVRLECTPSNREKIVITQKGNTLVIKSNSKNGNNNKRDAYQLYIEAPSLEDIKIEGVANISAPAPIKQNRLNLNIEGVCNINTPSITVKDCKLSIDGVCNTQMGITATHQFEAIVEGVGKGSLKVNGGNCIFKCEGVCNFTVDVDCKELHFTNEGVGKSTLSGTADKVDLNGDGVSKIDVRKLNAL